MIPLYTAAQSRELDRLAIEQEGIAGYTLMKRAAACTFHHLMSKWPECKRVVVFCGVGNNGGDGYIIAQLAHASGLQVEVYQLGDIQKQKGDALTARTDMQAEGLQIKSYVVGSLFDADIIIDAMLGTGLERDVKDLWSSAIQAINLSSAKVVAVDIPSGLHADTGCQLGEAVVADITVTFIGRKQGLFTADGKACCGEIIFDSLGIPISLYDQINSDTRLLSNSLSSPLLKPRNANSYKGQHGHVLIVGGAKGMNGAVTMAAIAALRSGCGLVSVATHPTHAMSINLTQPEIMSHGVETGNDLNHLIESADVIILGPGLGQSAWANDLFQTVIKTEKPLILDADGLNLLASDPIQKSTWIFTPHPGEAGRLLNSSASEIQKDRFRAIKKIQEKYTGTCVLKGAGTLIYDGGEIRVCPAGNPGMASAGMGDVLSGVLGGIIAQAVKQSFDLIENVAFGVLLHALAGDAAAKENGEKGLLATDLLPHIRRLINGK